MDRKRSYIIDCIYKYIWEKVIKNRDVGILFFNKNLIIDKIYTYIECLITASY